MSKTRSLRLYTYDLPCTVENAVSLLNTAGWSVTDSNGRIHIWNTETDEWEIFSGIYERFTALKKCCFKAYCGELSADVRADGGNCLDITLEAKYTAVNGELVFDFNFYYNSFVNRINDKRCVIERIEFEEY